MVEQIRNELTRKEIVRLRATKVVINNDRGIKLLNDLFSVDSNHLQSNTCAVS